MKTLLLTLLLPSAALAVRVESLPFDASEGAISEATTNIPFAVDFGTMSRIEFTLTLDASPTNAVEVSVGTDGDGARRGVADVGEAVVVEGLRPGTFVEIR